MTRWLTIALLVLVNTNVWAKEYGQKSGGYDRAAWEAICAGAPYREDMPVLSPEAVAGLASEGWMEPTGQPPVSMEALNKVCRALGFLNDGGEAWLY